MTGTDERPLDPPSGPRGFLGNIVNTLGDLLAGRPAATSRLTVLGPEAERRLLCAALLAHVATADGRLLPVERARMLDLLRQAFRLEASEAEDLLTLAETRHRDDLDLVGAAAQLKRRLAVEERRALLAMMSATAIADDHLHEFEEGVLARAATLLDVPVPDFTALAASLVGREKARQSEEN